MKLSEERKHAVFKVISNKIMDIRLEHHTNDRYPEVDEDLFKVQSLIFEGVMEVLGVPQP